MNNITQQYGNLVLSQARYTGGPSKSNTTSNVIRLVIFFLAFSWRMRKLYVFICEMGLVNVDVGEISMSITESIFLAKWREYFLALFSCSALGIFEDARKCHGGSNSNTYFFKRWVSETHYNYSRSIFG